MHNEVDGLSVLGFPCNQCGNQEPGTNEEIAEFTTSKYDVNFPMFAKLDVNGENEASLYSMMKADQPGDGESSDVKWNFEKFLIDPEGVTVARWDTGTTPEDIRADLADFFPAELS